MCTAITYRSKDHYFGRTLDSEYNYQESVTITPRNFLLPFRRLPPMEHHYAMIGMAFVNNGYPLYYDATNEHGLSMAGLNFPHSAKYFPQAEGKENVTPFELIPWILGSCKTVAQGRQLLENANLVDIAFRPELPLSPLHWILADKDTAIVIEQTADGLQLFENPVGVLTNEPKFDYHLLNLQNYLHLTSEEITNTFASNLPLRSYSRGLGTVGLPGDLSSPSRFIRAAFTKHNSVAKDSESASISQVLHILGSVHLTQGLEKLGNSYSKTIYTSCCNTSKGIYYYTTYENSQITGVRLHGVDLNSSELTSYPLIKGQQIKMVN